jgi:hypothetical protein
MPAWTFTTPLSRLTLARAENVNALFSGISTGFASTYTKAEIDAYVLATVNYGNNSVTFAKMQQIASMKVIGNVTGGTANVAEVSILDEDAMTSNSATALATQRSIKAYADTKLALAGGTMTGDIVMGGTRRVTGLAAPSAASDAVTKAYADGLVAALIASSPAALDTLNELAAALGNDPNFASTMTTALAGKLSLTGGSMSGTLDMNSQLITNLPTPTQSHHATPKGYVDGILGSATAAAASAAAAATSYDNFDDRYLGAKSADPTLDNDGDVLITGALYFNSVTDVMKVWNGAAWQQTDYNSTNVAITGGTITDITDLAVADGGTGASTADGATTNLNAVSYGAVQSLTPTQQGQARSNVSAALKGHIYGLTLSNNGTDANNYIDIAAGEAASDASSPLLMVLGSAITKRLDDAWAVGTNNGGLFSGSKANSTWYHVFAIMRPDTGVVDAGFDTSLTAANRPGDYTHYRRVGSVRTDGSGNIFAFFQSGDYFQWTTAHNDISTTSLGTSAVTGQVSSPLGIRCIADLEGIMTDGDEQASVWISSPQETDATPGTTQPTTVTLAAGAANFATFQKQVMTDTSSQIRYRSNVTNTTLRVRCAGYHDTRGRHS